MPRLTRVVLEFLEKLLLRDAGSRTPEQLAQRDGFIGKFQQATSPVAAKGIEDTALYRYNRLLSLNEVGSDPTRFGLDPADVHRWMADRRSRWPTALSATSTHDTKRGEDVRARLNVLSEMPGVWRRALARWRTLNRRCKREVNGALAPDPNEEYLLYQTLLGSWPFDPGEVEGFGGRIEAYVRKALREAKHNTSWLSPDEAYETAVVEFVRAILDRRRPFLETFLPIQARVAELGIYNSLAQLLIKITAPGVPDFYQGTELWDLSLVDPDNRRPVDYAERRRLLEAIDREDPVQLADTLLEHRTDGRIKVFTTTRALRARLARRALFEDGEYIPVTAAGARADCLFAYARRSGGQTALVCVPRLVATLLGGRQTPPLGRDVWDDTSVELPAPGGAALRDVFTGETYAAAPEGAGSRLDAADLFRRFPVALLLSADPA
jgi:(1->4)-alpha-D-glucan 1-alpha-D-glucosylmutase